MPFRGDFLTPILVNSTNCFVNLPSTFIHSHLSNLASTSNPGAVILEISWEGDGNFLHAIRAAWIGGIARVSNTIEIPREFSKCINLENYVAQSLVPPIGVHVIDDISISIALQVHVEPISYTDWELAQRYAEQIEIEFLRQICVVNDHQVIPIYIPSHEFVQFRVFLQHGQEFAKLTPQTELIIAPLERPRAEKFDSRELQDSFYQASPILSVVRQDCINAWNTIYVHPEVLLSVDGIKFGQRDQNTHITVALWSVSSQSSPNSSGNPEQNVVVGTLKCSLSIDPNQTAISSFMQVQLECPWHSRVQFRVLRFMPLNLHKVRLNIFGNTIHSGNQHQVVKSFCSSLKTSAEGVCVYESGLAVISISQEMNTHNIGITIEGEPISDSDQMFYELLPIGANQRYIVLGGKNGVIPEENQIVVCQTSSHQQNILKAAQALADLNQTDDLHKFEELWVDGENSSAYSQTTDVLVPLIHKDGVVARIALGSLKCPAFPYIYGDRSCGKTTLCHTIAHTLEKHPKWRCSTIVLSCRELCGMKMSDVKEKLSSSFEQAKSRAPSLLILDDLDSLIPQEEEHAGVANSQSRQLAEHVLNLCDGLRISIEETATELHVSYQQERTSSIFLSTQCSNFSALKDSLASGIRSRSVALIAVCREEKSLHSSIRGVNGFRLGIPILPPTAIQREFLLPKLLCIAIHRSNLNANIMLSETINFGDLATKTEAYSRRDLYNASERSVHQFIRRYLRNPERSAILMQEDIELGIQDFTPSALRTVQLFKSTTLWDDVGGLYTVRETLRDTLEYPTKFSRLFRKCPIQLPAGILLYGPSGCGKTFLASAVAGACGLNFISVKGPEVLNKYIGASEQAIRDLFHRAAAASPCVLFLDEFDAIAPRRGADNTGVTDRLVNQLLTFLDGLEARVDVYVLAATSRPDMIDPALLRPGRLDRSLYCGFPNAHERYDILRVLSRHSDVAEDAYKIFEEIANAPKSELFSGADLQALIATAQLELVHEAIDHTSQTNPLAEAEESSKSKVKNSKLISSSRKQITAKHLRKAFDKTKPSTSTESRLHLEKMYAKFSRSRTTTFNVADADASMSLDSKDLGNSNQRSALA